MARYVLLEWVSFGRMPFDRFAALLEHCASMNLPVVCTCSIKGLVVKVPDGNDASIDDLTPGLFTDSGHHVLRASEVSEPHASPQSDKSSRSPHHSSQLVS